MLPRFFSSTFNQFMVHLVFDRHTGEVLSEETIQAVRERVSIVDVIGERVKLRQRGRNLIGLCPFHKEKTPSFNVNEERNFYHCFGCDASGDAIKFLQETEGLSFAEAIRELAGRLGIAIEETGSSEERRRDDAARRRREELLAATQAASEFFQRCLEEHPLAPLAIAELERRGLNVAALPAESEQREMVKDALTAFHVGYAPHGWDGLSQFLLRRGLSATAAESVGLIAARKSGGGYYDRFRHRLMFAVIDLKGRVVGFSGRALEPPDAAQLRALGEPALGQARDEKPAKYINSPESPIYKKREVVFGLYQARNTVRREDCCILVEGNFDVLSLHARGLTNVAAPLGTAFTSEQAAQLRRFSPNVTLLFDGDAAGRRASAAAREACAAECLTARVATLPPGIDPDDLAKQRGIDAVRQCVRNARGMLEYLIETALDGGFNQADPEAQGRKIQEVLALLASEQDPTTRALAQAQADRIAARLGVGDARSLQALRRAIQGAARSPHFLPSSPPERARSITKRGAIEAEVLGVLVEYPELVEDASVQALLPHASGRLALDIARLARSRDRLSGLLGSLEEPLRSIAARRMAAPQLSDRDQGRLTLLKNLQKIAALDRKQAKLDTVEKLRQAMATGDTEAEMELLEAHARQLGGRSTPQPKS